MRPMPNGNGDAAAEFRDALRELHAAERFFDAAEPEQVVCATYRLAAARARFGLVVAKLRRAVGAPEPAHAASLRWLARVRAAADADRNPPGCAARRP